jgi:hypothetical protein
MRSKGNDNNNDDDEMTCGEEVPARCNTHKPNQRC